PVVFEQSSIRAREVCDINLNMMTVIRLDAFGRLTEEQILIFSCAYRCGNSSIPHPDVACGAHDFFIERPDSSGAACGHCELDISDTKFRRAELRSRPMAVEAIPPWTSYFDELLAVAKSKFRA